VQAISHLAGLDEHHPDVDVRYEGLTERDVDLAPQISAAILRATTKRARPAHP
jgi:pterin-4a-carbinolamine dehydratase